MQLPLAAEAWDCDNSSPSSCEGVVAEALGVLQAGGARTPQDGAEPSGAAAR